LLALLFFEIDDGSTQLVPKDLILLTLRDSSLLLFLDLFVLLHHFLQILLLYFLISLHIFFSKQFVIFLELVVFAFEVDEILLQLQIKVF